MALAKVSERQYVTDVRGKKRAVIVPVTEYDRLMEDLHDLAVVAERRGERTISLDQMRRRLKSRGLI
jgi:PHD/YefM family antitoxin component YafN of YafNO toxin-antitoxin module